MDVTVTFGGIVDAELSADLSSVLQAVDLLTARGFQTSDGVVFTAPAGHDVAEDEGRALAILAALQS